jgi:hypothetical protein
MNDEILAKLRLLLSQPDRDELLDDPRRLAELVRERLGVDRRREAGFLNTVLQEGVPKRLLAMSASSLSGTMLDNYAKKTSEEIGLREEIARSAIGAWAEALGLKIDVGYAPAPPAPPVARPAPIPDVAPAAGAPAAVRVAGIALIAQGGIKLLVEAVSIVSLISVISRINLNASQLGWIAFNHIVLIAISVGAIAVGVRAVMNAPGTRAVGIGLCATGALVYVYFAFRNISFMFAHPVTMAGGLPGLITDVTGVVILGGSVVCFWLWWLARPAAIASG